MLGSVTNPDPRVRRKATDHLLECVDIMDVTGSRDLKLWFSDGTNYPGQDDTSPARTAWPRRSPRSTPASATDQRFLLEYKLFEPAFYTMDVPDWGTAYAHCIALGPKAQVVIDTGHHAPGTNIEFIVAVLLRAGKLGGFDFNSRFYADDDLMVGSADPFQLFRIMWEVRRGGGLDPATGVAFMLDQCHNIEPKIAGQIRSVMNVQEATAKALLVDADALGAAQAAGDVLARQRRVHGRLRHRRPADARRAPDVDGARPGSRRRLPPLGLLRDDQRRAGRRHAGRVGGVMDEPRDVVDELIGRSNRLGADPRNTNYAGGNTSAKGAATDPVTGEPVELLWVKGSGGDLGTLTPDGLAVLRLDRLRALVDVYPGVEREDEMVAAFDYCLHGQGGAAPSIDTAMHGLVDAGHVDHLHPDSGHRPGDGRRRRGADEGVLRRPGRLGAVAAPGLPARPRHRRHQGANPAAIGVILGGHGITAWGSYQRRVRGPLAGDHPHGRRRSSPSGVGPSRSARSCPASSRCRRPTGGARAAALAPVLRGLASTDQPQVGHFTDSRGRARLLRPRASCRGWPALGTSCPDHFLRTKVRPLVLDVAADRPARRRRGPAARAARRVPRRLPRLLRAPRRAGLAADARRRSGDRARARRRHVLLRRRRSRRRGSPASSTSTPST